VGIQEDYFYAAVSVDNVIFGFNDKDLKVLLIERNEEPFLNKWALPGALVNADEDLEDAPVRILKELTGLTNVYLDQVQVFGQVNRHPMGRVFTVAYYSLINIDHVQPTAHSFAEKVEWHNVVGLADLAFDHKQIIDSCLKKLRKMVQSRPIGFELLPEKFTLSQLQSLYEAVLNTAIDKRNFRKKILKMNILSDHGEMQKNVAHRPAKLYQFDPLNYKKLELEGFNFEINLVST